MNLKSMSCLLAIPALLACKNDIQEETPWWQNEEYNTEDTGDSNSDDDGKGDDDDKGDDDGKGEGDVPDCPEDFDPKEPCEGDPKSTYCMYEDDLYYCENGGWVLYGGGDK